MCRFAANNTQAIATNSGPQNTSMMLASRIATLTTHSNVTIVSTVAAA